MTVEFMAEAIATLLDEGYTAAEVAIEIELGRLEATYLEIVLS